MLNLIYSGALTTLLIGLAFLIQYEKHTRVSNLARTSLILSSIAYLISICLFSEPIAFKAKVLLRDVSLIYCVMMVFRVFRNFKKVFPITICVLILGMSNFGFNYLHDSFKISKFSILKDASASTNSKKTKKENPSKQPKIARKSTNK